MMTILTIIQVLIAIAMIAIILVQRGPGAAAGSGFGAGASGTVFGSRGSGSFLTRSTSVLAALFFILSLAMAIIASKTMITTGEPDLGIMAGAGTSAVVDEQPGFESADDDELPVIEPQPAMVDEDAVDDDEFPTLGSDDDSTADNEDDSGN